jgi:2-amino-4-hydroxy-6-hydroxymethyldihydropteridine diphosphokinase
MGTPALIGLGSNLGDRRSHLDAAVAALAGRPGVEVRAVSRYYGSTPVGGPAGQGSFLNASAVLETSLDPVSLLRTLQAIEHEEGRVRSVRWGERTLDLDLLLFGDQTLDTPELTLPHPRMAVRRFVLVPSAEVMPTAPDPLTGRSLGDLLANLDRRPSCVALSQSLNRAMDTLSPRLAARLGGVGLSSADDAADLEDRIAGFPDDRWFVLAGWPGRVADDPSVRFAEVCARNGLRPTFVVSAWSESEIRPPEYRSPSGPAHEPDPILRIRPTEPILASGGLIGDGSGLGPEDALLAEILAACDASRAAVEAA